MIKLDIIQLARRSLQRPSTPSSTSSAPGNSAALVDVEQSPTTLVGEPPVSLTRETVYIVHSFKWHIVRLDPSSPTSHHRRASAPSTSSASADFSGPRRAHHPRRRRATGELQRPRRRSFRQRESPSARRRGASMGPVPVPETRYQCRSRGCQDDTGPETSFGRGELTDRCRWRSLPREGRPTAGLSHRRNSRGC